MERIWAIRCALFYGCLFRFISSNANNDSPFPSLEHCIYFGLAKRHTLSISTL